MDTITRLHQTIQRHAGLSAVFLTADGPMVFPEYVGRFRCISHLKMMREHPEALVGIYTADVPVAYVREDLEAI